MSGHSHQETATAQQGFSAVSADKPLSYSIRISDFLADFNNTTAQQI